METTLIKKGWLLRAWKVTTSAGVHLVAYEGTHKGFELVRVDGVVAAEKQSWLWYVPMFDFEIGGLPARVDVRVWPWMLLRAIRLRVAGEVCYSEGFEWGR